MMLIFNLKFNLIQVYMDNPVLNGISFKNLKIF